MLSELCCIATTFKLWADKNDLKQKQKELLNFIDLKQDHDMRGRILG